MARPRATAGQLRGAVREVLALAPGWGQPDGLLVRGCRDLLPVCDFTDTEVLEAAEWNFGRGYVTHSENEDTDEREWRITREGLAKQSIT